MKLHFPELTFSAGHYIPGHETCGGIHGHTYFVRDLEILIPSNDAFDEVGMSIDFGLIKGYFKTQWHHKFIIPEKDEEFWRHIYEQTGYCPVNDNRRVIKHTTCEHMAVVIREDLADILSRHYHGENYKEKHIGYAASWINFSLWEGPNQDVKI